MATNLPNRAQITYTYGNAQETALSNETNTTLLDEFTMEVTKTPVASDIRSGSNASYILRIDNNGPGTLYNPTITDDLGDNDGVANAPLRYIDGSAKFYVNGDPATGTASSTANQVVFTSSAVLQPGDNLIVVYAASVDEARLGDITNTTTVQANSGSTSGALITDTATAVITLTPYANVSIFKTADKSSVVSGDTLTYTFTLMNTGAQAADSISFVDALPPEFTVTSVSYTANGTTTPIDSADYSITPPNTLTIPASGSSLVISVPAATVAGPGITTITVTGTVA